ncbi:MAG: translation initiation factor IF-3 [Negativicutes bacterium]
MRINEEIRAREVRVVSANNDQLGVMLLRDALQMAAEQQLDLVEVAPNAKPPACRIMDFGKFRFEQQKRDKEAKKKQKVITLKEVKLRPNIEDHDYEVKKKNAQRFIADGDKVKVTIMFRGRELAHPELGRQILVRMANEMKEPAIVEREPKIEGRNMFMILTPRPAKVVQAPAKTGAQPQTVAAHPVAAPQKKEE